MSEKEVRMATTSDDRYESVSHISQGISLSSSLSSSSMHTSSTQDHFRNEKSDEQVARRPIPTSPINPRQVVGERTRLKYHDKDFRFCSGSLSQPIQQLPTPEPESLSFEFHEPLSTSPRAPSSRNTKSLGSQDGVAYLPDSCDFCNPAGKDFTLFDLSLDDFDHNSEPPFHSDDMAFDNLFHYPSHPMMSDTRVEFWTGETSRKEAPFSEWFIASSKGKPDTGAA